jgi:RNA polymerase sigma factor (sigma-70 family)
MRPNNALDTVPASPFLLHRSRQRPKHRLVSPGEIERLVEEARKLVPMFARRYMGRGVPFEDLIGAGNLGVVEAAHRFDAERGAQFSSYAGWWIQKAIFAAIRSAASVVVVPRYAFERRRQVLEAITSGRAVGRDDRATNDVAADLGLSSKQAKEALAFAIGTISLDAPVAVNDTRSVGDRLARPAEEGPEAVALDVDRTRCALAALAALSPRQRLVIALRFGLETDGAEPATLADVARVVGVSRERVRQIEIQALTAIRDKLRKAGWKLASGCDARRRSRGSRPSS